MAGCIGETTRETKSELKSIPETELVVEIEFTDIGPRGIDITSSQLMSLIVFGTEKSENRSDPDCECLSSGSSTSRLNSVGGDMSVASMYDRAGEGGKSVERVDGVRDASNSRPRNAEEKSRVGSTSDAEGSILDVTSSLEL